MPNLSFALRPATGSSLPDNSHHGPILENAGPDGSPSFDFNFDIQPDREHVEQPEVSSKSGLTSNVAGLGPPTTPVGMYMTASVWRSLCFR